MEKFFITGCHRLRGAVRVSGSKNASLAVMAATILAEGTSEIENVPHTLDGYTMVEILKALDFQVSLSPSGKLSVDGTRRPSHQAPDHLVTRMRGSFHVAGPLLARLGRAVVPLPGGCVIGSRPVDLHLRGFRAMGADVRVLHGEMIASASRLRGAEIELSPQYCSVGATINLMMAATLAEGTTVIRYASTDPDAVECAQFLVAVGADIEGIGTRTLVIRGVDHLEGAEYRISGDRIEAGTYLVAGTITQGEVIVQGIVAEQLERVLEKLEETGAEIHTLGDAVRLRGPERPRPIRLVTSPYPGFPTDLQPPAMVLATVADGQSVLKEAVFNARLTYLDELRRMGAQIATFDATAVVDGVPRLSSAPVVAPDLRAGAALILAGLAADGVTEVSGTENIDRGYVRIEQKLAALGAEIYRVDAEDRRSIIRLA